MPKSAISVWLFLISVITLSLYNPYEDFPHFFAKHVAVTIHIFSNIIVWFSETRTNKLEVRGIFCNEGEWDFQSRSGECYTWETPPPPQKHHQGPYSIKSHTIVFGSSKCFLRKGSQHGALELMLQNIDQLGWGRPSQEAPKHQTAVHWPSLETRSLSFSALCALVQPSHFLRKL